MLLDIYLKLIQEIEAEEIVESLESVISTFPEQVRPYANRLSEFLIDSFEASVERSLKDESYDNSSSSVSILNTLTKLIDVYHDDHQELINLSEKIFKTLKICLSSPEYLEAGANILTCLLFYSPENSLPNFYQLLHLLQISILGTGLIRPFAEQNIEEIYPAIANFISKYPELTYNNIDTMIAFCFKLFELDQDYIYLGCELFLVILENFQGKINQYIPMIIQKAYECFSTDLSRK